MIYFIQSEMKKSAEIAAYFQRYEDAERIYLDMDRRYHLLINMLNNRFCFKYWMFSAKMGLVVGTYLMKELVQSKMEFSGYV